MSDCSPLRQRAQEISAKESRQNAAQAISAALQCTVEPSQLAPLDKHNDIFDVTIDDVDFRIYGDQVTYRSSFRYPISGMHVDREVYEIHSLKDLNLAI